ncbi:sortase [Streptomyces sp. NPDC020800]|uniref:sortase n=1 Tax=Streptomyces sp. NPDC020800 TaxID=3365092 RepID=UPI0037946006
MTHSHEDTGSTTNHISSSNSPRPKRNIRPYAAVGVGAVMTAAAVAVTLFNSGGTAGSTDGAASPSTPNSSSAATLQTEPDPLTTSADSAGGAQSVPDETGTSATAAGRALDAWSSSNPASRGDRAVGGDPAAGPGGSIHQILRIPALGTNWVQPIYEGVDDKQLRAGVGHFPDTEQPGQIGNVALAGHRSGVADPAFRQIDNIKPGSAISVTTADRITYTYTVVRVRTVEPTDVNVIAQVPDNPAATPTKAKLTLVTCWPATGHSKRVVVEADLTSSKGGA